MNCEGKIKVLIADDHQLFRSGVISILKDTPEICVIGEAANGEELFKKFFELYPDVILTDISMPMLSGIEAVSMIKETLKLTKVLFLSMYDAEEYIYYCLKAGGLGLVSKNILKNELIEAIKTVNQGERYFGKEWTDHRLSVLLDRFDSILSSKIMFDNSLISPRETEILKYISDGLTSKEIAVKLKLSKRTVDTHRTHLMQKLSLKSLPELIRFAIQFTFK